MFRLSRSKSDLVVKVAFWRKNRNSLQKRKTFVEDISGEKRIEQNKKDSKNEHSIFTPNLGVSKLFSQSPNIFRNLENSDFVKNFDSIESSIQPESFQKLMF